MPFQKLQFKPGVNRDQTNYTNEGGWYECDKIRFRQGTPEKIGGWTPFAGATFQGICRSLWNWATLIGENLVGVGTNLYFYIIQGSTYYDITPIRKTEVLTNPFTATNGSNIITISEVDHGCVEGDTVIYSGDGIVGLGGNITASVLTGTFLITFVNDDVYTITVSATANATDVSGSPGGGAVVTQYETNTGPAYQVPLVGWGVRDAHMRPSVKLTNYLIKRQARRNDCFNDFIRSYLRNPNVSSATDPMLRSIF